MNSDIGAKSDWELLKSFTVKSILSNKIVHHSANDIVHCNFLPPGYSV